jgi:hypothetical protein
MMSDRRMVKFSSCWAVCSLVLLLPSSAMFVVCYVTVESTNSMEMLVSDVLI